MLVDGWHLLPLRGEELKPQAGDAKAPGCLPGGRGGLLMGGEQGEGCQPSVYGEQVPSVCLDGMSQKKLFPIILK